jgi:hypothetical protein
LNLREGQPIQVRLRGRDLLARPEFISDVDEVERLLCKMMTVNPRVTAFVPVRGPDGQIDRSKVEAAVGYGFRLLRWHLDRPPAHQPGSGAWIIRNANGADLTPLGGAPLAQSRRRGRTCASLSALLCDVNRAGMLSSARLRDMAGCRCSHAGRCDVLHDVRQAGEGHADVVCALPAVLLPVAVRPVQLCQDLPASISFLYGVWAMGRGPPSAATAGLWSMLVVEYDVVTRRTVRPARTGGTPAWPSTFPCSPRHSRRILPPRHCRDASRLGNLYNVSEGRAGAGS